MADGSPRAVRLQLQSRSSTFSEAAIRVIRSLSLRPSVISPAGHSTDEEQPDADDAANHEYSFDAAEGDHGAEDERYSAPTLEDDEQAECWVTDLPPVYLGTRLAIVLVEQPGLKRALWLGVEEHTAKLMGLALRPAVSVPVAQRREEQRLRQEQRQAETARLVLAGQHFSSNVLPRKHVFCALTVLDQCQWVAAIIMISWPRTIDDAIPTMHEGGVTLTWWLHLEDIKVQLAVFNFVVDGLALVTSTTPRRPIILSLVLFLLLISGVAVSIDWVSLFILWRAVHIAAGIWLRMAVTQYQELLDPPRAAAERQRYNFFRVLGQAYQITIGFWSLLLGLNVGSTSSVHGGNRNSSTAGSLEPGTVAGSTTQQANGVMAQSRTASQAGAQVSISINPAVNAGHSSVSNIPPLYWNPVHSSEAASPSIPTAVLFPSMATAPAVIPLAGNVQTLPVMGVPQLRSGAVLPVGTVGLPPSAPQQQQQEQQQEAHPQAQLQPQPQLQGAAANSLLPAMQQQLTLLRQRMAMRNTVSQNGVAPGPAQAAGVQLTLQRSQSCQQDTLQDMLDTHIDRSEPALRQQHKASTSSGSIGPQPVGLPVSPSFWRRLVASSPSKGTPFRHVQQQESQVHEQPQAQQAQQQEALLTQQLGAQVHVQQQALPPTDRPSNLTARQRLILANIEVQALTLKQRTQVQGGTAAHSILDANTSSNATKPALIILSNGSASTSVVEAQPNEESACPVSGTAHTHQHAADGSADRRANAVGHAMVLTTGAVQPGGQQSIGNEQLRQDLNAAALAAQQLLDQLLLKYQQSCW